jgi:hypothetical protein
MKKIRVRHHRRALTLIYAMVATLLSLLTSMPSPVLAGDKMTAEEVVAKHLESLGPDEARSSAHSRVVAGTSRASFKARNTSGAIDGRAVLGSLNRKVLFGMAFDAPKYPGEKFGFDGKKLTVSYLSPGIRSPLGTFLLTNSNIVKEGLMGGTLSAAWPLLNLSERKVKLEYSGTEKIDNQLVHKLRYSPSNGSDVSITLFFDAKTFQHVRTQYDRVIASRLNTGGVDNQANQRETRYKIIENFSDYKKEGDLTLPHTYTIELQIERTNASSLDKWEMNLSQFAFNQEIDEKAFNVEAN